MLVFHLYGPWSRDSEIAYLVALSLVLLIIEFLAILMLLGKSPGFRHLGFSFLQANAITFVPTQVLSLFVMWFAVLLPLYLEPVLYEKYFRKRDVYVPSLRKKVVIANLINLACGAAIYLFITWLKGTYLFS